MIEDWVGSIREGRDPIVTLESGLADLAVVEAAGVSLQEDGRFVAVYQSTSD
jgi:predicted dehydrogenase